ncbi:MAG: DUF4149 domain-containing protein [Chamaesiphon sp.]|nr:DUF4149 domain-containing protein [Chamaesiphon sp.]
MTQTFNGGDNSRFSVSETPSRRWQNIAIGTLGFWLSGSLILDFVIMPTMWATGMMESSGFASASYSIFWIFNRVELICAAVALSSILALIEVSILNVETNRQLFAGAVAMVVIALSYTFILTPQMSGLGINLDILATRNSMPAEMDQLHTIYWILEASKIGIMAMLMSLCDRSTAA